MNKSEADSKKIIRRFSRHNSRRILIVALFFVLSSSLCSLFATTMEFNLTGDAGNLGFDPLIDESSNAWQNNLIPGQLFSVIAEFNYSVPTTLDSGTMVLFSILAGRDWVMQDLIRAQMGIGNDMFELLVGLQAGTFLGNESQPISAGLAFEFLVNYPTWLHFSIEKADTTNADQSTSVKLVQSYLNIEAAVELPFFSIFGGFEHKRLEHTPAGSITDAKNPTLYVFELYDVTLGVSWRMQKYFPFEAFIFGSYERYSKAFTSSLNRIDYGSINAGLGVGFDITNSINIYARAEVGLYSDYIGGIYEQIPIRLGIGTSMTTFGSAGWQQ